jgi:serine/threonine-protein kinase
MDSVERGRVIGGRYRLERPLAQGGMGAVWVAQHMQLDTAVAVKFMDAEYAASPEARARFEREAKASAQIKHPNAVQVYDYGLEGETPYIAMELLEGEDLDKRLQRVGRLSLSATACILTDACKALRRAHEMGLIHRDLKPANLFLIRHGDEEITKLLDFGIAKSITPQISGKVTKTGSLVGSPFYMSPEQVRGGKQLDPRSDIWSLGVIAFECITGGLPFPGDEIGDVLVAICSDPIPVPSRGAPRLTPEVDRFFARALVRELDQRFQSAREFAEAITALARAVEGDGAVVRALSSSDVAAPGDSGAKGPGSSSGAFAKTQSMQDTHPPGARAFSDGTLASTAARSSTSTHGPSGTLAPAGASLVLPPGRGSRKGAALVGAAVAVVLAVAGFTFFRSQRGTPEPEPSAEAAKAVPAAILPRVEPAPAAAAAVDTATTAAPVVSASAARAAPTAIVTASAVLRAPTKLPSKGTSPPAPPKASEPVVPLHGRD